MTISENNGSEGANNTDETVNEEHSEAVELSGQPSNEGQPEEPDHLAAGLSWMDCRRSDRARKVYTCIISKYYYLVYGAGYHYS